MTTFSLSIVVVLYLAHALPLYFYNVALPTILRHQGVDLRWIGMLSLLYIPRAFKFLWAPWIDRIYSKKLGKRTTWLLLTQMALVLGIFALAFTQFDYGLVVFVVIGLWISSFAATQDIGDLDRSRFGKGILNVAKTKIILNLENDEAQRVQHILHLSDAEIMSITRFERGQGLISTNSNHITVSFKASPLEKQLITTDRMELNQILKEKIAQNTHNVVE